MTCSNCKSKVDYSMNFCPSCGFKLHFPNKDNTAGSSYSKPQLPQEEGYSSAPQRKPQYTEHYSQTVQPVATQILDDGVPQTQESYYNNQPESNYTRQQTPYSSTYREPLPPEPAYHTPEHPHIPKTAPPPRETQAPQNNSANAGAYPNIPTFNQNSVPYDVNNNRPLETSVPPPTPSLKQPAQESHPIGVGSVKQRKSLLLPSEEAYDNERFYDEYYDEFEEDEEKKSGHVGLLLFLLLLITITGTLVFLQMTERIHLEELPDKVMSLFEKSEEQDSMVESEDSAPNTENSAVGTSEPASTLTVEAFDIAAITQYPLDEALSLPETNTKITISDVVFEKSLDDFVEIEGQKYLILHITLENIAQDATQEIRYNPYHFKLYVTGDEVFHYPVVRNGNTTLLQQGTLATGKTAEGTLVFAVPNELGESYLCFTPWEENTVTAKFKVSDTPEGAEEDGT